MEKLQVVITCAGSGQRFVEAGYKLPKYLIEIGGTPVISHVVGMFDQLGVEPHFTFIVRQEDWLSPDLGLCAKLEQAADGRSWGVKSIKSHSLGPVASLKRAYAHINDESPVIVSYCDFYNSWSVVNFMAFVSRHQSHGCLVTHSGFHPHRLNNLSFAFLRTDGANVLEVKEKAHFTNDPMAEPASNGIYYFKTGALLKKYCDQLVASGQTVNGEYYVTMAYNLMIADKLRVSHYETDNFYGLGTPEDLENVEAWRTILRWGQIKTEADLLRVFKYWNRQLVVLNPGPLQR